MTTGNCKFVDFFQLTYVALINCVIKTNSFVADCAAYNVKFKVKITFLECRKN